VQAISGARLQWIERRALSSSAAAGQPPLPAAVQAALDESLCQLHTSQRGILGAFRGVFAGAVTLELAGLLAALSAQHTDASALERAAAHAPHSTGLRRSASWSHLGNDAAAADALQSPRAACAKPPRGAFADMMRAKLTWTGGLSSSGGAQRDARKRVVDLDAHVDTLPSAAEALVATARVDEAHLSTRGAEALTSFINREVQVCANFRAPSAPWPDLQFQQQPHCSYTCATATPGPAYSTLQPLGSFCDRSTE
jgi:hypothetical protein